MNKIELPADAEKIKLTPEIKEKILLIMESFSKEAVVWSYYHSFKVDIQSEEFDIFWNKYKIN
jgi:hypothetical protein